VSKMRHPRGLTGSICEMRTTAIHEKSESDPTRPSRTTQALHCRVRGPLVLGDRVRMSALGRSRHPKYGRREGLIVGQGSTSGRRVRFERTEVCPDDPHRLPGESGRAAAGPSERFELERNSAKCGATKSASREKPLREQLKRHDSQNSEFLPVLAAETAAVAQGFVSRAARSLDANHEGPR
jgi:hypothetical protein